MPVTALVATAGGGYPSAKIEGHVRRGDGDENGEHDQAKVVRANKRCPDLAHGALLQIVHAVHFGRSPQWGHGETVRSTNRITSIAESSGGCHSGIHAGSFTYTVLAIGNNGSPPTIP